jgi:hypothetical protein
MAAESGLSRSTIGRIWREFRLKPHLWGAKARSTSRNHGSTAGNRVLTPHRGPAFSVSACPRDAHQPGRCWFRGSERVLRGRRGVVSDSRSLATSMVRVAAAVHVQAWPVHWLVGPQFGAGLGHEDTRPENDCCGAFHVDADRVVHSPCSLRTSDCLPDGCVTRSRLG